MGRHTNTIDPDRAVKPWDLWVPPEFLLALLIKTEWAHPLKRRSDAILVFLLSFSFFFLKIEPFTPSQRQPSSLVNDKDRKHQMTRLRGYEIPTQNPCSLR